ncbi:zinc finger protein OZF-like [Mytilus californianus]|uniref:zinc finger protein OZF-like n=1 Tax=Mytilus californianus TaxID=6549 RepID=UPI0022477B81|nr:zinc finger protein OZF-like [Mytilus californianus]XP_052101779.1 zinc finger protein OZF-like [Mytilus californianus]
MGDSNEDTDEQLSGNEFVQVKEEPLEMEENCGDEIGFMNMIASTETDTNTINTSVTINKEAPVTADSTDDNTEKTLFLCDICFKPFTHKPNLRKHMRIHEKIKPYKCDICRMAFTMKQNMQTHRLTHTGERPHQCSVCGKTFNRSHHVTRHMAIHLMSKKQFKCEICSLDFHRKDHLQVHMKTHEPPVFRVKICPYCGKCYKGGVRLNKHIKDLHTETKEIPEITKTVMTAEKTNECGVCGKLFAQLKHLESHMLIHSILPEIHECNVCGKSFSTLQHLKEHDHCKKSRKKSLEDKRRNCIFCGRIFMGDKRLENHIKKLHLEEYRTYGMGEANESESFQLENLKEKRNEESFMDETRKGETNATVEFDTLDVTIKVEPEET